MNRHGIKHQRRLSGVTVFLRHVLDARCGHGRRRRRACRAIRWFFRNHYSRLYLTARYATERMRQAP